MDLSGEKTVYNPTSCEMSESNVPIKRIRIIDLNGHVLRDVNGDITDLKATLKASEIPFGIYLLETTDIANKVRRTKFVQLDQ